MSTFQIFIVLIWLAYFVNSFYKFMRTGDYRKAFNPFYQRSSTTELREILEDIVAEEEMKKSKKRAKKKGKKKEKNDPGNHR